MASAAEQIWGSVASWKISVPYNVIEFQLLTPSAAYAAVTPGRGIATSFSQRFGRSQHPILVKEASAGACPHRRFAKNLQHTFGASLLFIGSLHTR